MNESIPRAADVMHGQEITVETMATLLDGMGRPARQRTTFYGEVEANPDRLIARQ